MHQFVVRRVLLRLLQAMATSLPRDQPQLCFGVAPNVPLLDGFALEATTLRISREPAAALANAVLDFFNAHVVASISKVRYTKLAIKADVYEGGVMCSIQVRIYRTSEGEHAVEFQRRCGDHVAFHTAFKAASVFFTARFGDSVVQPPCVDLPKALRRNVGFMACASLLADAKVSSGDFKRTTGDVAVEYVARHLSQDVKTEEKLLKRIASMKTSFEKTDD